MEKKEIFDLKSTNKLLICLFSMKFMPKSGSGRILASRIPDIRFFVKIRPDPDIRYSPSIWQSIGGCSGLVSTPCPLSIPLILIWDAWLMLVFTDLGCRKSVLFLLGKHLPGISKDDPTLHVSCRIIASGEYLARVPTPYLLWYFEERGCPSAREARCWWSELTVRLAMSTSYLVPMI